MAQLKDTIINGSLRATDTIYTNNLQNLKLITYSSSAKTAYGAGSSGQVLKSDGTNTYWGSLSSSDISGMDSYLPKSGGNLTGVLTSNSTIIGINRSGVYKTNGDVYFDFLKSSNNTVENRLGSIFMATTQVGTSGVYRPNKMYFRHYSYNPSTGAIIEKWDQYYLPEATASKESNDGYLILTEKDAVTVPQGGTGAKTALAARANLGTAPYVQGVFYGTCSTAQATQAKQVTLVNGEGFTLATGVMVSVKFTYASAGATMTMAIRKDDSSSYCEAKNLCRYHTTAMSSGTTTSGWRAGAVVTFVYDGAQWERIFWENSTYYNTSVYCETAAATAAKVGTVSYHTAATAGKYFQVMMIYDNTAASALTFNLGGSGDKPIYIDGTVSSSTNYTLPKGLYIVYYDGTNFYFRKDDKLTASITGTAAKAIADGDGNTISSTYLKLSTVTTAGDLLYATGNGAISRLAAGTSGYLLQTNGTGNAPSWAAVNDTSVASTIVKRNSNGEIHGSNIVANNGSLASTYGGTPWSGVVFNTTAVNGSDYITVEKNAAGVMYFQAPAKVVSANAYCGALFKFRIQSYNSTTGAALTTYEDYDLPDSTGVTPNLQNSTTYNIVSTKNFNSVLKDTVWTYTVNIPTTSWSSVAPYTCSYSFPNWLASTDIVIAGPGDLSSSTVYSAVENAKLGFEHSGYVINVYCYGTKPTISIPVTFVILKQPLSNNS